MTSRNYFDKVASDWDDMRARCGLDEGHPPAERGDKVDTNLCWVRTWLRDVLSV